MASGRTGCRSSRSAASVTVDSPLARSRRTEFDPPVEKADVADAAAVDADVEAVLADALTGTLKSIGRPTSGEESDQRTNAMLTMTIAAAASAHRAAGTRRVPLDAASP